MGNKQPSFKSGLLDWWVRSNLKGSKVKLTISRKIILIGVVSMIGLISLSILRDAQLNKLYDIGTRANTNVVPSLIGLIEIRDALDHINLNVSRYLSATDSTEIASIRASLMDDQLQASQSFDVYLKNNVSDEKDRELIQRAQDSYTQYMQKVWSTLPHKIPQTSNKSELKRAEVSLSDLRTMHALSDTVDGQLHAVMNYNFGLINKYQRDALKDKENISLLSLWVTSIVAIVIIGLVVLIKRSTMKQLGGEPEQVVESIGRLIGGYDANIQWVVDKNSSLLSQVSYLILHDNLTQLPNKLAISNQVQNFLGQGTSSPTPFSLFEIKVNGLKDIAEVVGYKAFEGLTSVIVNRLQSVLPDKCILASLNSDLLGVLLPNVVDDKMLEQYANHVLRVFESPFNLGKQEVIFTANMGVVCYSEEYQDKDSLFEFARLALKHSKTLGENHYQFYQAEFSKQYRARLEVEGALHHALQNKELELYYQPQVDILTEQIIGAEALVRWKHPILGMIPPDKFIPIAEESGSIIEIGYWILLTAFKAATIWNVDKTIPMRVSINLSPRQFAQKDFVPKLTNLMTVTGCKSEWIKLEVTESLLIENTTETMKSLISIAELGIPISMDDFGTGYSSLSYLTTYPISQLKIDRSFMNDIPIRLDKCEVVRMIMRIAEIIHSDVVAEGVETLEQVEFLRSIKCNVVQGYYYYKPMPFDDFDHIITAKKEEILKQELLNKDQRKKSKVIHLSRHQV